MRTRFATAMALTAGLALLVTVATPDARDAGNLVRDLGAETAGVRDAAARRLLAMGDSATPALKRAADTGSPGTRRRARALLALIDDGGEDGPDARRREADALVRAALNRDGHLRADGAQDQRLARLGDVGAHAVARAAQREANHGAVRPRTGAAIGRHPSAIGVRALTGALARDRILGSTLVEVARQLEAGTDAARDGRTPAATPLLSDGARNNLEAVLDRPLDPRRRGAAALLTALDTTIADRFVTDPDPRVRIEAARALGRQNSASAGDALERLALDVEPTVRRAALEALRKIPGRPRPKTAHANADHADVGVRAAAAELLGRDAVRESMYVLHRMTNDRSVRVRAAAERSLISIRRQRRRAAQ